jgi:Spy/CpxP family protein refolding chaperone
MRDYRHGNKGMMDVMRMAERLDLTDEQRDRIGKIIDEMRPRLRENGFAMMDNREEVYELMQEDKVNDKKLRSLTRKQGDLVADMMYMHLKMRSDIHAVLTDEQREKMQQRGKFRNRLFKGDMPMSGPDEEDDD